MTFLDLPKLVTCFSFRFVGEAFDSIKTVTKPSHCLLLDSNHLEILFLFWNKLKSQTAADSIPGASTRVVQHPVAVRVIGAVAASRYALVSFTDTRKLGIEVIKAGAFLDRLFDAAPDRTCLAISKSLSDLTKPPYFKAELAAALSLHYAKATAEGLAQFIQ